MYQPWSFLPLNNLVPSIHQKPILCPMFKFPVICAQLVIRNCKSCRSPHYIALPQVPDTVPLMEISQSVHLPQFLPLREKDFLLPLWENKLWEQVTTNPTTALHTLKIVIEFSKAFDMVNQTKLISALVFSPVSNNTGYLPARKCAQPAVDTISPHPPPLTLELGSPKALT